jgi:hypothetical protein
VEDGKYIDDDGDSVEEGQRPQTRYQWPRPADDEAPDQRAADISPESTGETNQEATAQQQDCIILAFFMVG